MLRKLQWQVCSCMSISALSPGPPSDVHLDSTFLHRCRVGALIYDSEAGWSHKTLCCLSRSWTKATCLYMSWVPSPSSSDCKHHQNHRLFCTYFLHPFAFYTFNWLLVGGWTTQDMLQSSTINPCEFWILIIWRRLWPVIQSQPSVACTTHAFGIPNGCIREEDRLWTSCCTLSFWFGNTPCGFVR